MNDLTSSGEDPGIGCLPDTTRPNIARVYDHILGGKDNISQEVRADFRNRDRT